MIHTLIAVFDNRIDAQSSMDELLESGYGRDDLVLRFSDVELTAVPPPAPLAADASLVDTVKHYFLDIFGTDRHQHALLYAEALRQGHHVLTLTAHNEAEAERAADIVERYHPVNIDEREDQWLGADAVTQRAGLRHGGLDEGLGGVRIYPRPPRDGVEADDMEADAAPAFSDPFGERDDDVVFRSHWRTIYASGDYDDFAPAYRYGASMAKNALYRGRIWSAVEDQLKTDWQRRHPGSTWERFKAAIRHGWERVAR